MAGSKKVKTKNLKVRRQLRRTFGALFMASAIVVALVPTDSIEAARVDETTDDRSVGDYPLRKALNDPEKTIRDLKYVTYDEGYPDLSPILDGDDEMEYTSYNLRKRSDGSWVMNWQFKYAIRLVPAPPAANGIKRGIITQYNPAYSENTVTLSSTTNAAFFVVDSDTYRAFYSPAGTEISPTFTTVADGGGFTKFECKYDEYITVTGSASLEFLAKWRPVLYEDFKTRCDTYTKYLEDVKKYNEEKATWDYNKAEFDAGRGPNPGNPPTVPTVVDKPDNVIFNPALTGEAQGSAFSDAERYKYYCEKAEALGVGNAGYIPGTGYTLVPVTDESATGPDGAPVTIYIPQGGEPIAPARNDNDENKFLVTQESVTIFGIGDRAFAGVVNVRNLTLPSEISYVGDEAFKSSTLLESINMQNVAYIGNRAFKDCTALSKVTMVGTRMIGTESFCNTAITEITIPQSVTLVGTGAYAYNSQLRKVIFDRGEGRGQPCAIAEYAFYNCNLLDSVDMAQRDIRSLGNGAFAMGEGLVATGSWIKAELPVYITGVGTGSGADSYGVMKGEVLGEWLFQGRSNLQEVIMPPNYGTGVEVELPSNMFIGCSALKLVEFPNAVGGNNGGMVKYDPTLFYDVLNPDLCVKGPEKSSKNVTAFPRESTWEAFSRVSDYVPYIYQDSTGKMCYEVSDGTYILQANEDGELTSCTLRNKTGNLIDVIIPGKVGDYEIKSIRSGCFDDKDLRAVIRSITIEDDSVQALNAGVFSNLPKLEWVEIGNSVENIGEKAFENCPKLIDVTFNKPKNGHENFKIGTEAFKTNSPELTIHGDIVPGYAPFEFALGKESGQIDANGKRICYKSLSPDHLTVMYDNATDEVTLLEYPKYANLDKEHADHMTAMENYYYDKYAGNTTEQQSFISMVKNMYDSDGALDAADWKKVYADISFGPWVTPQLVYSLTNAYPYGTPPPNTTPDAALNTSENNTIFKDLVPFYDKTACPYSITGNYENASPRGEYETSTLTEQQWINGTLDVIIPAGVTSIDAKGFFSDVSANGRNISTYFPRSTDAEKKDYTMVTKDDKSQSLVGGLFSGEYQDFKDTSDSEEQVKGNDRIRSVVMHTVKKLPDYAFDSCERLERVDLGAACADIGTAPFRGCTSLATVGGNAYYTAQNGIIYSKNNDESYTIEECLAARGDTNRAIPASGISVATDPLLAQVSAITQGAFENCDKVTQIDLDAASKLEIVPVNCFSDMDKLVQVILPEAVRRIESKAFGELEPIFVTIPGKEVHISTDAMVHTAGNTITTYKDTSAEEYALYNDISLAYLEDRFKVSFIDYNGSPVIAAQYVQRGKSAVKPENNPTRDKYVFDGWEPADFTNVQSDMTIIAQYSSESQDENKFTVTFWNGETKVDERKAAKGENIYPPLAPVRSGYVFKGWVPTTYTDVQSDLNIMADFVAEAIANPTASGNGGGSGGSNSSTSPSPTASGTNASDSTTKYTVSVSGGSGSGSYAAGAIVTIGAYAPTEGKLFDKWTSSSTGVGFLDATAPVTTFTMPAGNVTITATYKTNLSSSTATGTGQTGGTGTGSNTGTSTGSGNSGNGNASIEITKPGIPETGLASASVNGSLDNFVVKITEDAAATAAAVEALQNKYGDISQIRYFPMDVSLYDSTGVTKITDTVGITVDITMPLPTELVPYAGNNKVASTLGGSLENMNTRFTTIDGIPCVRFTATHFSPYVVYVDTANLSWGDVDSTPKTGDFLHPKWFLVIGLVSMSMLLFLKRDKRPAMRAV